MKAIAPAHMAYGAAAFLSYDLITEFLRHHDETNLRPKLLDHLLAMSLIGTGAGFIASNSIRGAFQGFLFIGLNVGFLSYWAMKQAVRPGGGRAPAHIYYDADVTKEEKERIEMMDQVDILAHNMSIKPAYGQI